MTPPEILVLGDSLPLGRPHHGIYRHNTWPYLLSSHLNAEINIRAEPGASVKDVLRQASLVSDYWIGDSYANLFAAAYVQFGIVDCTPRLVPRFSYRYVRKIPFFSLAERNPSIYRVLNYRWTPETVFKVYTDLLYSKLRRVSREVFFIEIPQPAHHLVENVGDYSETVGKYNQILENVADQGSLVRIPPHIPHSEYLLPDGHHYNELGHRLVADMCKSSFEHSFGQ